MRNRLLPGLVAAILIAGAAPLGAETLLNQQIQENGVGLFDTIDLFIQTPGVSFLNAGTNNVGWTNDAVTAQYVSLFGTPATDVYFVMNFLFTASAVPVTVDMFARSGGAVVDSATGTYNGGWSFESPAVNTFPQDLASATPEPATLFLIGGVLALLGAGTRKRKSR